ncbi:MAG: hypothetical protein K8T90_16920 [Planctomycetes bacterium]|nr:hypothetical protein [Planctomycetota bacterium]
MTRRRPLLAVTFFALAGCASGAVTSPPVPSGPRSTYVVEARFACADGTVVAAPRVVFFGGDVAQIAVTQEAAYVRDVDVRPTGLGGDAPVAVAGTLATGLTLTLFAESIAGNDADVALAFDFQATRVAEAAAKRALRIAPPPTPATDVDLPRTETSAMTGAQRMTFGTAAVVATFPSDAGDVTVSLRVTRLPALNTLHDPDQAAGAPAAPLLASLAHAAAAGTARVGTFSFEEEGAGRASLQRRSVTTVLAPGAHAERRLDTAFVSGYAPHGASLDPQIATFSSGCDVTVGDDGKFHARWTAAPTFTTARIDLSGHAFEFDAPTTARAGAATPIRPGETEFPMGAFTGGAPGLVRLNCAARSILPNESP